MQKATPTLLSTGAACHEDHAAPSYSGEFIATQREPSKVSSIQGPYVKMSSWASLLQAIAFHDSRWDSWEELLTSLHIMPSRTNYSADQQSHADATPIVDHSAMSGGPPAATQAGPEHSLPRVNMGTPMDTVTDASAPAETPCMTKVAWVARAGALASSLCSPHNLLNMRVIMIGGRALLSRQSRLACGKTSMKSQWMPYGRNHVISLHTAGVVLFVAIAMFPCC